MSEFNCDIMTKTDNVSRLVDARANVPYRNKPGFLLELNELMTLTGG